ESGVARFQLRWKFSSISCPVGGEGYFPALKVQPERVLPHDIEVPLSAFQFPESARRQRLLLVALQQPPEVFRYRRQLLTRFPAKGEGDTVRAVKRNQVLRYHPAKRRRSLIRPVLLADKRLKLPDIIDTQYTK